MMIKRTGHKRNASPAYFYETAKSHGLDAYWRGGRHKVADFPVLAPIQRDLKKDHLFTIDKRAMSEGSGKGQYNYSIEFTADELATIILNHPGYSGDPFV